MESREEELERTEHELDEELESGERAIFRAYPGEEHNKDLYKSNIVRYASRRWNMAIGDEHEIDREFWEEVLPRDFRRASQDLEEWIYDYGEWYKGERRDPIDPRKVGFWHEGLEGGQHLWRMAASPRPLAPFSDLAGYIQSYRDMGDPENMKTFPWAFTEVEVKHKMTELIHSFGTSSAAALGGLNPVVAVALAREWLPTMIERRKIVLGHIVSEVEKNVQILYLLQTGTFTTTHAARHAAMKDLRFEDEKRKLVEQMGRGNRANPWTLRDLISNMGFVVGWARLQAGEGSDLDGPAPLEALPVEVVSKIASMVNDIDLKHRDVGAEAPRSRATHLDSLDTEIHDRIKYMVKRHEFAGAALDEEFFWEFATTRVDIGQDRVDRDVSSTKSFLKLIQTQPTGALARDIFERHSQHVLRIRERLVKDMRWLLDASRDGGIADTYIEKIYAGVSSREPPLEQGPPLEEIRHAFTRKGAAEHLKAKIVMGLRRAEAAHDMVLQLWMRAENVVDDKDPPSEHKQKRRCVLPTTTRARWRQQALEAWIVAKADAEPRKPGKADAKPRKPAKADAKPRKTAKGAFAAQFV